MMAEHRVEQRKEWWPKGESSTHLLGCLRYEMTGVMIRDGDSFEGALKRFTRKVQQEGILSEAKRHMHYEPPSVKRKRKAENRARKERKARAKAAARGY